MEGTGKIGWSQGLTKRISTLMMSTMVETKNDPDYTHVEAWAELGNNGFSFTERHRIRKAFMDFGVQNHASQTIQKDGEYYKNVNVPGYLFSTEAEARFAEAMLKMAPEGADKDKVLQVMSITIRLLGVDSEWSFKINP